MGFINPLVVVHRFSNRTRVLMSDGRDHVVVKQLSSSSTVAVVSCYGILHRTTVVLGRLPRHMHPALLIVQ